MLIVYDLYLFTFSSDFDIGVYLVQRLQFWSTAQLMKLYYVYI